MEENVKYKVIKDYPTVDGMLYKNEIVKLDNGDIKKDKDRASVILYLNQNSDSPRPLP